LDGFKGERLKKPTEKDTRTFLTGLKAIFNFVLNTKCFRGDVILSHYRGIYFLFGWRQAEKHLQTQKN
jgi:hypothetical protein